MDGRVQHDAHELNRLLIDALEKSLKYTEGESLCRNIYGGSLSYRTTCLSCNYTSIRSEPYYDLNVQIIGCDDLINSLRTYCASEILQGDSAYYCEQCKCKRSAHRSSVINNVPQVLTLSLNRFRIDKSTNWRREKVISSSAFPILFDLKHFTVQNPSISIPISLDPITSMPTNNEMRLVDTLKKQAIWIEESVVTATRIAEEIVLYKYYSLLRLTNTKTDSNDLNTFFENGVCLEELDESTKQRLDTEIIGEYKDYWYNSLHDSRNIDSTVISSDDDDTKAMVDDMPQLYLLSTVIMHKGSAFSGHYFAYIRDNLNEGNWNLSDSNFQDAQYCRNLSSSPMSTSPAVVAKPQYIIQKSIRNDETTGQQSSSLNTSNLECIHVEEGSLLYDLLCIIKRIMEKDKSTGRYYFNRNRISGEIRLLKGDTWTNLYNNVYGRITDFLSVHSELFEVSSPSNQLVYIDNNKISNIAFVSAQSYNIMTNKNDSIDGNSVSTPHVDHVKPSNEIVRTDNIFHRPKSLNSASDITRSKILSKPVALPEDDADLALAIALQDEEYDNQRKSNQKISNNSRNTKNSKRVTSNLSSSQTVDENKWETVSRKRNKLLNTNYHENYDNNSMKDSEKSTIVNDEKDSAFPEIDRQSHEILKVVIRKLVEDILSFYFGHFYEFNDSIVKPMLLKDVVKAFEGTDSAYLLVYRRLKCREDLPLLAGSNFDCRSNTNISTGRKNILFIFQRHIVCLFKIFRILIQN